MTKGMPKSAYSLLSGSACTFLTWSSRVYSPAGRFPRWRAAARLPSWCSSPVCRYSWRWGCPACRYPGGLRYRHRCRQRNLRILCLPAAGSGLSPGDYSFSFLFDYILHLLLSLSFIWESTKIVVLPLSAVLWGRFVLHQSHPSSPRKSCREMYLFVWLRVMGIKQTKLKKGCPGWLYLKETYKREEYACGCLSELPAINEFVISQCHYIFFDRCKVCEK